MRVRVSLEAVLKRQAISLLSVASIAFAVAGCGSSEPVAAERYVETDQMISQIDENLASAEGLVKIVDIDHSRLGHQAGSIMSPARALIFSDPQLETELIQINPLVALDLPLRILAFEDVGDKVNKVIFNSFDYLVSRYQLDPDSSMELRKKYNQDLSTATNGLPQTVFASFPTDAMSPDGIVTIESPYSFEGTIDRVTDAIDTQSDTMHFGAVDFQARASELGIDLAPSYLILFGGPGPGGKAMAEAPTLGLDGFCQKFLIWQDSSGRIHLSFNDLLALAERQGVKKNLALRIINYRLNKTFSDALSIKQS